MPLPKEKEIRDCWKRYTASLKTLPDSISELRLVVLDTETTGFDRMEDRILNIGALVVQNQQIRVETSLETYLEQTVYCEESAKIHGILKSGKRQQVSEPEGMLQLLEYLNGSVLVAHHAAFDVGMIDMALRRMKLPGLKNEVVDTSALYYNTLPSARKNRNYRQFTLDQLADTFKVDTRDRHTALGDAYITARILLRLLSAHRISGRKELVKKGRYHLWW